MFTGALIRIIMGKTENITVIHIFLDLIHSSSESIFNHFLIRKYVIKYVVYKSDGS